MIIYNIKEDFYKNILGKKIFIISSITIDSLCTVKILTILFRTDHIKYSLTVCESREKLVELLEHNKNIHKNILLINCGANVELSNIFKGCDNNKVYIIDNNYPFNIYNILDDECIRIIQNEHDSLEENSELNELLNSNIELHDISTHVLEKYERCSYYGSPSSITAFDISNKLGKDVLEFAWLAICGLTEMFISRLINKDKYAELVLYLQQQVVRLGLVNNDDLTSFSIICENALHVHMYTHWNLMDSLQKSIRTASHFQIWSVSGKKRLYHFLADIGIPLSQCKQSFCSMDADLRNNLKDLIIKFSPKFGLSDISYPSFVARFGYGLRITAADYAFSLISIIDYNDHDISRESLFFRALDYLELKTTSNFIDDIPRVTSMISNIFDIINCFVELHYIICAGPFLFGAATENQNINKLISNGMVLKIVSLYALITHTAITRSRRSKELPFILTVPIIGTNNSIMIAIPPISSQTLMNDMSHFFRKAIYLSKIKIISQDFSSTILTINTNDRTAFLDALVSVMN